MSNRQEALKKQFKGFLKTPQIWSKNGIFEYDLFTLSEDVPSEIFSEELPEPDTFVLGKRMEHFFKIFIERYSEEEILAHNEQIFLEKQTIGELDFLLKHKSSHQITHVELVFKFYLYDPEIPAEELRWIGPNRKDRLAKKLERLSKKQFPLLRSPATEKLLKRLELSAEDISQKLCFKACLFVPWQLRKETFKEVNPEAIQGFWIKAEDFTAAQFGAALFHSPKKPDWSVFPQDNTTWTDYSHIKKEIEAMLAAKRAPLLWMKTQKGEFERFFVVWW
ncbi:MAG: DUF1853 family protein [Salinimicrobium sp.]